MFAAVLTLFLLHDEGWIDIQQLQFLCSNLVFTNTPNHLRATKSNQIFAVFLWADSKVQLSSKC